MDNERPAVYDEDGKHIYRASAFGGCTKMLAAIRLGYETTPPPQKMVDGPYARGHAQEEVALKKLREEGWEIKDRQKEFDLVVTARNIIRCHVDAISAEPVVEIKSQNKEEYDKWRKDDPWAGEIWRKYSWQVSVLILATKRRCMVVRINDELELDTLVVKEPPHSMKEIRAKIFAIERIVSSQTLPDACDFPMFPCPVFRLHSDDKPEPIDLDDEGIDEHAKIYDHARKEESKWKEIKEAARRALRIGIKDDRVRTKSGIVVNFFPTKRRQLSEKLLEEHGLKAEDVTTEEIGERIDVKVPPKEDRGEED